MAATNPPLIEVAAKIGLQKVQMLVDTAATVTILPKELSEGLHVSPSAVTILAANKEPITVYGETTVDIAIPGLRRNFTWRVVIADVSRALLGLDFFDKL